MSLISANADISWSRLFPQDHIFQVMSNGQYCVIYKDTISGNLYYRTSADSGVTWSAAHAFAGSPTPTNLNAIHLVGNVLYMWYSGATVRLYTVTYNTGTNTFGAQTVYTYTIPGITSFDMIDAILDENNKWCIVASFVQGGRRSIGLFMTPGYDGTLSTYLPFLDLRYFHSGITQIRVLAPLGFYQIYWYDGNSLQLWGAPVSRTAWSATWHPENLELAQTLTDPGARFEVTDEDTSAADTLVISHNGLLHAIVRTGSNSYGVPIPLGAQMPGGVAPSVKKDGADLYVGYPTEINETAKESYIIKRTGTRWGIPTVLAGGDNTGFNFPYISLENAVYQDANHNVYYRSWTRSGAPLAPTGLTPTGNITTTTPTLTWVSNRAAPADAPKSFEALITRVSDNFLMHDSGEVTETAPTYDVPGGAGLVPGTAYRFQVREKDSLSALGAGTWGPYSALASFTPVQASVDTITSVTSLTTTFSSFPATITGNDLSAHIAHTHPGADSINSYRLNLYAADAVTLLERTAAHALLPSIVDGAGFDTVDWTPTTLLNAHTYFVSVSTTDASNGVVSESAKVEIITAFVPPPTPTDLAVFVSNDEGSVSLSWNIDEAVTLVLVEWQPYTETGQPLGWLQLSPSGALWNQATSFCQAPQLKADYRVSAFNAEGIQSEYAQANGVFLDNALDYAGIWLADVSDPSNRKLHIGYVDNWDALKRDLAIDVIEFVPMGGSDPIQSFGLTDYWILGTSGALKVFLPAAEVDSSGGIRYGADQRDMAISMFRSRAVLVYRDRRFPVPVFVRMMQYEDQPNEDVNTDITLELHKTSYFGALPVIGSLELR